jgi:hypothetical protein
VDILVFSSICGATNPGGASNLQRLFSQPGSKFADLAARKPSGWFLFAGRGFTSLWQKTSVLIE